MKKILYAGAVALLTAWLIGVLIYGLGLLVHLLLFTSLLLVWALSRNDGQGAARTTDRVEKA